MKLYGLIDCNNFFVSCERLFRPDLAKHPTIVAGVNDGVVVARSEEAKALGIPMGVPYFKVRDIVKEHNVAVFSGNFELYRDISSRIMESLRLELDEVYQYSIDEAFFRLPDMKATDALEKLSGLKKMIEKNIGVPVSLGVGKTMTIAKYASEKEKRKSGVCVLVDKDWQKLTPEISLSSIWGVGGQTAKKMRDHNISTVADLLTADRSRVEKIFGVHGLQLQSELSEVPTSSPDQHSDLQKSIMSTRSLGKTTTIYTELEEALTYHINRTAEELREIGGKCGSISVILNTSRYGDWFMRGGTKEALLIEPTNNTLVMLKVAIETLKELYEADVPYKKVGIVLRKITSADSVQLDLFSNVAKKEEESVLMKTVDSINEKLGRGSLMIGRIKNGGERLTHRDYGSPRYTTNWNEIKRISNF